MFSFFFLFLSGRPFLKINVYCVFAEIEGETMPKILIITILKMWSRIGGEGAENSTRSESLITWPNRAMSQTKWQQISSNAFCLLHKVEVNPRLWKDNFAQEFKTERGRRVSVSSSLFPPPSALIVSHVKTKHLSSSPFSLHFLFFFFHKPLPLSSFWV